MSPKNHTVPPLTTERLQMLQKSNSQLAQKPLSDLLAEPDRFAHFSRTFPGLLLDFSRVKMDEQALAQLLELARTGGVERARDALFAGEVVNPTEHRPALHMALRSSAVLRRIGGEEAQRVKASMSRMLELAAHWHAGRLGEQGGVLRHIVHVGIGGSLLGTQLLSEALSTPDDALQVHFLGSVDAHRREALLKQLDPAETVVVLVSKSFTTKDTLLHGRRLRDWLRHGLGAEAARQRLYAVTSQPERAEAFGISAEQLLYFSDWVGGRYSLWSPVSLSAAARIGPSRFRQLLAGAEDMDQHFCAAPLADNLPVLMALIGIWHRNVCGYPAWGVMPYDQRLRLLPAFLQQLVMESNGKSVTVLGQASELATAPVVFGETGTDAQHSVFQALHQGSDVVPLSFLGVVRPDHDDREAQEELLANLLAQMTALAEGRDAGQTRQALGTADDSLLAHRSFAGNRPSDLLLLDRLDAHTLGMVLALYEHRVFVESVLWGINAFDQWGVELGKTLTPGIARALAGRGDGADTSASLEPLLKYINQLRH